MQVRLRFGFVRRNPLRRWFVSRARNAGEIAFWICPAQPSVEIGREMHVRLLDLSRATLCGDRACRGRKMQVRARFGLVALHFWRKSRTKRSFWRLGASLLEEVSYETFVLETWRFTFGGSLVRNARFGDLALHFWRKSRTKRSFWRLGASLLEEVSYETLVLETWRFTFGGSLVRNARFGDLALHFWRKSRTKRSFWRLGTSLLEEVSYVLETGRFTFGGSLVRNARFGDFALHFWRKSRAERSFWRLGASLVELDLAR